MFFHPEAFRGMTNAGNIVLGHNDMLPLYPQQFIHNPLLFYWGEFNQWPHLVKDGNPSMRDIDLDAYFTRP